MGNKDNKKRGAHQNKPKMTLKEKLAKRREKRAERDQRKKDEIMMEKSQTREPAEMS